MYTRARRTDQVRPWRPGIGLIAVPLVTMAVIAAVDIASPPDVHLGPLLVVAPAITAAFAGALLTGLIGLLAVLTLVIIGLSRGVLGTENLIVQISSMVALSVLLVVFCHLRERHEGEMTRVRFVSEATQRALLPPLPKKAGPLRIASHYHAAEADARIGGDLYSLARTAGSTRLIIGDVRGKGLATLSSAAMLMGAFRAAAHRQSELPELVAYLEGSVGWGLAEFADDESDVGERFVTALILDIPDDQPVVHLITCGHPPPLVLRPDGTAGTPRVDRPAPPLGLGALADVAYDVVTFPFGAGDLLLLYTDGLIEARDRRGAFYPLTERASNWSAYPPAAFVTTLWADVVSHIGRPPDDDIALIAVQRGPTDS